MLKHVDLTVEEHQVVTLIGASGSGKSTLLRCVNLLETVDGGRIVVDGQEITNGKVDVNALRRKIGIVFQAYNLFPHMTVLENVTLAPRKVRGVARVRAQSEAMELLRRIGLAGEGATSTPTGSPAASSSASRSRGRSRCSRSCCCSTRSRARSTRSSSPRC